MFCEQKAIFRLVSYSDTTVTKQISNKRFVMQELNLMYLEILHLMKFQMLIYFDVFLV